MIEDYQGRVADIMFHGIENNALYIFTDLADEEGVKSRTEQLLRDADILRRFAEESELPKEDSKSFEGGYGRQVLGETWVNHHGHHGRESTRGVINEANASHPVLKGVENMWCPSDVYQVTELTGEPTVLVDGQVLTGMDPTDVPIPDKTTMPVAWVKNYTGETGNTSRVFCSTMGSSVDLANEGIRRLIVNGSFWCMGMEDQIPEKNEVGFVDPFDPVFFGFGQHTKGVRPCDLSIPR